MGKIITKKDRDRAKKFNLAWEQFKAEMNVMGFQRVDKYAMRTTITQKDLSPPKRADNENVQQERYEYHSRTGYGVVIIPGVLNGAFMRKGRAWMHIINEKGNTLLTRDFYRSLDMFPKLAAYARLATKITDDRLCYGTKMRYMRLEEKSITEHVWTWGKVEIPFKYLEFVNYFSKSEVGIIRRKEGARARYFKKYRTAKQFARDIRGTWKSEKAAGKKK